MNPHTSRKTARMTNTIPNATWSVRRFSNQIVTKAKRKERAKSQ
jgi:hypothetical protein